MKVNDDVADLNDEPADEAKLMPQKVAPAEPVPSMPKAVIPDAAANPPDDMAPSDADVTPVTALAKKVEAGMAP